jgi:hypothetical protein
MKELNRGGDGLLRWRFHERRRQKLGLAFWPAGLEMIVPFEIWSTGLKWR